MWEAGPEDHVDFMSDSLPGGAETRTGKEGHCSAGGDRTTWSPAPAHGAAEAEQQAEHRGARRPAARARGPSGWPS